MSTLLINRYIDVPKENTSVVNEFVLGYYVGSSFHICDRCTDLNELYDVRLNYEAMFPDRKYSIVSVSIVSKKI